MPSIFDQIIGNPFVTTGLGILSGNERGQDTASALLTGLGITNQQRAQQEQQKLRQQRAQMQKLAIGQGQRSAQNSELLTTLLKQQETDPNFNPLSLLQAGAEGISAFKAIQGPGGSEFMKMLDRSTLTPEQKQQKINKRVDKLASTDTKFTKSDRELELAGKISRGDATDQEKAEWELIVQTDPIKQMMRQMFSAQGLNYEATVASEGTPPKKGRKIGNSTTVKEGTVASEPGTHRRMIVKDGVWQAL